MIDRELLEGARDQEGLVRLLDAGLDWPVDADEPFQLEPEIAQGVKGAASLTVSRLVPETADAERLILLAEFDRPYVRRDLRELLGSVRRHIRETGRFEDHTGIGDTVFIVASPSYDDLRFVLFEEHERRLPRIRSFGWRREFIGRTVLTHNLDRLQWANRNRWETAWDVDALTDEFYDEFVKVFKAFKAATWHPGTEAEKHSYVQQLLNRLLFIAFIERMGWLKAPDGTADYLHTLWMRHRAHSDPRAFYSDLVGPQCAPETFIGLLRTLFFHGIGDHGGIEPGHRLFPLLGAVPYLNGGLFEPEEKLDVNGATVTDTVFDLLLGGRRPGFQGGLFRRFNFTVTESTPLDQEVAVDPEMLGKIFERIIIKDERHRTGTYYTPRPIVEFMVNEALKGYLTERGLAPEKAALLVDEDRVESDTVSFRPSDLQDTVDWLFEVRAVDPACGSGAYLLMLLQRLFDLVDRLEVVRDKRRSNNPAHLYDTKLRLLSRCVYGVDISEVAVRIAQLRMWLSLVVENRGAKPEPLPNFDYLIMCGDSLASPIRPDQQVLGYPREAIREYAALKRAYFHPDPLHPRPTKAAMRTKRAEIASAFEDALASSALRALARSPFDWEVDFAEVFDPELGRSGFDIVVMNPPYVTANRLKAADSPVFNAYMKAARLEIGFGNDLYVHFMVRALQLLKKDGMFSAITPTTFLTNTTKYRLREELLKWRLKWIIPLSPEIFRATVYAGITIVQKSAPTDDAESTYLDFRGLSPDEIGLSARNSDGVRIPQSEYRLAFKSIIFNPTTDNRGLFAQLLPLQEEAVVNGRRFAPLEIVAPALDTGIDSGNCRGQLFFEGAAPGRARMLQGIQVVRYGEWWANPDARFRYVNMNYVPDRTARGVGRGGKPSSRGEYWHFRGPESNHHVPERLLMRQTEDEPFVGYLYQGSERIYTDNTLHTLLLTPYAKSVGITYAYLLSVLNSRTAQHIYRAIA
jgi:tRNA1(Val) A37 N6-methylase TrmN6